MAMAWKGPWTEAELATLKRLWAQGVSSKEIARQLPGRSRSAVVATAHRHGFQTPSPPAPFRTKGADRPRPARPRPARTPARRVRTAPPKTRPLPPPPPPPLAAEARLVRLEQLAAGECRFPVGEDARGTPLFCGAPGRPWCAYHRARATRRPTGEDQA